VNACEVVISYQWFISPGFHTRWGTKQRENNFRVTHMSLFIARISKDVSHIFWNSCNKQWQNYRHIYICSLYATT